MFYLNSLQEFACVVPASRLHGHLKGEVEWVEIECIDFWDKHLEKSIRHGGLAGHEMDAIVCAGKIAGAVVLHGIVLTIVLSKLNDCVIYTGGESREALQEVSLLISRFQGSDCVGLLTIGGLLAADVVDFIGSLISKNIKLGAHAITFKNGATCSSMTVSIQPAFSVLSFLLTQNAPNSCDWLGFNKHHYHSELRFVDF